VYGSPCTAFILPIQRNIEPQSPARGCLISADL
jgi:hypothetical protein